jgi:adenosylhomocysteine nucleosidase
LPKIAIIAALERELQPLVKTWRKNAVQHDGRNFAFYESNYAVAVCGGIGAESARRAAEVAVRNYSPEILISAGLAGALTPELHVGETIFPAVVIDTGDGSRHETAIGPAPLAKTAVGRTVLATYSDVATSAQKHQLAKSYGAHAVDMEAAAVARAAESHNLLFISVKAVSDELDFEISGLGRFVRNGQFQNGAFVGYIVVRPWLWLATLRLARNTKLASENLCAWLRESALTHTIVAGQQSTGGPPVPHNPKLG